MPPRGFARCSRARRRSGHTSISTWSRWTLARQRSAWSRSSSPRRSSAAGRPWAWCSRPTCATRADELAQLISANHAARREVPLTIRLVKGAYWDHEVVEARQHGWLPPVYSDKPESDRSFEALSRSLIDRAREAPGEIRVAIASHNLRSISQAIAYNRMTGGADEALELQVLRGLGDELAHAAAAAGFRVRSYCPVGDLVAGMAYLVRRLLENTANESFLAEQARGAPLEELLAAP